ncbi:hypothetical protein EDC96DRAFT_453312, partial [Choanephora cucurbitarum]
VEDRGTGVGSKAKGHRRYGGKRLEKMCGQTVIVCITNKHMTSQMCLHYFQKMEYPLFVKEKDRRIKKK